MMRLFLLVFWLLSCSQSFAQMHRVYTRDAKLVESGATPYTLLTNHYWFSRPGGQYDTSKIDLDVVERRFQQLSESNALPMAVVNVEVFSVRDRCDARDTYRQNIKPAIEVVREFFPTTRLGWYAMVPERRYWTPIGTDENEKAQWQEINDRNMAMFGHLFDFSAPSIYDFYPEHGIDLWLKYAEANIDQAKRWNKPCYPFLWPMFHNKNQAIPEDRWRKQLEFCRDNCDGIFVFGNADNADGSYNWRAVVVEVFAKEKS